MMENKNLKPTVHIYGNIINWFCKTGHVDQALCIFCLLINEKKISPDNLICSSIVLALFKSKRINEARIIVKRVMPSFGLLINLHTLCSLKGEGDEGVMEAYSELEKLIWSGIKLDAIIFN